MTGSARANGAVGPLGDADAGLFAGPGETRGLARDRDWSASPLGAVGGWPPALRAAVRLVLDASCAMCLYAGPAFVMVYNDAYRGVLGAKHPGALGRPGAEVWAELWPEISAQFAAVRETGEGIARGDVPFRLERGGGTEEAWFDYALSPVRDDPTDGTPGAVVAVLAVVTETTARLRVERALAAEQARLVDVVRMAPAVMAVLRGPDHVIALANAGFETLVGGRSVQGRPLAEALPEAAAQGFVALLDGVLATGEPVEGREVPYRRPDTAGVEEERFVDFVYQPLTEADGTRSGIFVHGVDITEQVRARREVERLLAVSEAARVAAEHTTHQLHEQATELEMQAEELQATALQLEERTEEAEAAQRAAEAERARAAGILEATSDAYFALDAGFRVVAVNAAMEAGCGMPRDVLLGQVFWDLFPGALGTAFERHYRAAAVDGVAAHFEHDYSDGRLDLVVSVDAYPAEGGGVVVFWRDITDRVRIAAERERLLAAERRARADADADRVRMEAVLGSIADAFYLLDRDWRFTHVNDAAEPLLQTTREQLLGRTLWEAFPDVVGSVFEASYREAMTRGRVTAEEAYYEPLGTWFDVRTYPWSGGVMVHFRDIGARKEAEAERERLLTDAQASRAEAEAANRAKGQFLAVMSHELRTPLNAIAGYAELIELEVHGPVTEAQRAALARIQTSQRHLQGLIAGVLDYSRIEAGAAVYRLAEVRVAEVVEETEALVAPQLRAKGIRYVWAGAARDLAVHADREKLQQILLNLVGNAVKFTHPRDGAPGRIEVACEVDGDGGRVSIHVRDNGEGIEPDQLAHVFEPFVQADQAFTRAHDGVGLGLAISRDLARGMGGDIAVESTPGAGSTFTLTLPRSPGG